MKLRQLAMAIGVCALGSFGGCASTGSGMKLADVKDSVPVLQNGKGRVYFYTATNLGVSNPEIHVNETLIGHVKGGTVFFIDLRPGHYQVDSGGDTNQADFTLALGDTRYVKFDRSIALVGSVEPEVVSRSQGQEEVQSLAFDQDRVFELIYPLRKPAVTQ